MRHANFRCILGYSYRSPRHAQTKVFQTMRWLELLDRASTKEKGQPHSFGFIYQGAYPHLRLNAGAVIWLSWKWLSRELWPPPWEAHHHSQRTYNSLQCCHYLGPLTFSTTCGGRKTRCSPRTRTLTRSHTYVNGTNAETNGYAVTQNTFLQ